MASPFSRTGLINLYVWFYWLLLLLCSFSFFFHTVNTWRAGGENVRGQKEQNRLPSTSWGRRHITLMVSVNISLTPVPLLAKHLPPLFFPLQPTETHRGPLLLQPPPGAAPWGPVCFPARGTGGGTLMRCSGHREMRHNLPVQGLGEIAVFTF